MSCIHELMKHGADVEAKETSCDATPLHFTAAAGKPECVKVLLDDYGALLPAADKLGRTVLHHTCMTGNVSCIHELIKRGADVEARTKLEGSTPLHMAALANQPDFIKTLIDDYSASINAINQRGWTPLYAATSEGHIEVVKALTSYPQCDVTVKGYSWLDGTALDEADVKGYYGIKRLLKASYKHIETKPENLEMETRPVKECVSSVSRCNENNSLQQLPQTVINNTQAEFDQIEGASSWIDKKVYPQQLNCRFNPAQDYCHYDATHLTFASRYHSWNNLQFLLETCGADVSATDSLGRNALHRACTSDVDANAKVTYLLQRDKSLLNGIDKLQNEPLFYAALSGNSDVISTLIEHGADVSARGQFGRTALHVACHQGHVACIHELMRHGADVGTRDSDLEATSLHLASTTGQRDCITILLEDYGADVNAADKLGATALHVACQAGHVSCIHELMAHGADIHARCTEINCEGKKQKNSLTPLHLAAICNQADCVKTLIEDYGADVNALSKEHLTPLHFAASDGHIDVVKALLSYPQCDITIKTTLWFYSTALDYAKWRGCKDVVSLLEDRQEGTSSTEP